MSRYLAHGFVLGPATTPGGERNVISDCMCGIDHNFDGPADPYQRCADCGDDDTSGGKHPEIEDREVCFKCGQDWDYEFRHRQQIARWSGPGDPKD